MKKFNTFSDQELVDEIVKAKNMNAFGEIYERYASIVYNKALIIVKNKQTAEDLTHDIFIKIYFNLPKFKAEAKLSTWIYAVTYNFCIDYLRKNKKFIEIPLENNFDNSNYLYDDENDETFINELKQIKLTHLKEILHQLPHKDKIILLMKYQDDMSIHEIMQILEIKESAVKMRLKRAKNKVLAIYNEKYKNELL